MNTCHRIKCATRITLRIKRRTRVSGRLSSSCSTSGTRRITRAKIPLIIHERELDCDYDKLNISVIMWHRHFVTVNHDGDRKSFTFNWTTRNLWRVCYKKHELLTLLEYLLAHLINVLCLVYNNCPCLWFLIIPSVFSKVYSVTFPLTATLFLRNHDRNHNVFE